MRPDETSFYRNQSVSKAEDRTKINIFLTLVAKIFLSYYLFIVSCPDSQPIFRFHKLLSWNLLYLTWQHHLQDPTTDNGTVLLGTPKAATIHRYSIVCGTFSFKHFNYSLSVASGGMCGIEISVVVKYVMSFIEGFICVSECYFVLFAWTSSIIQMGLFGRAAEPFFFLLDVSINYYLPI